MVTISEGVQISMPSYAPGDYVKVEFADETTGIGEWMWIRVEVCDDERKQIVGRLDNEPLNDYEGKLGQEAQLIVSYAQVREHRKSTGFTKH